MNKLLDNLDRVHTTEPGLIRIRKNLGLDDTVDIVEFIKKMTASSESKIYKEGKNWYIKTVDYIITINSHSYTIITAHRNKL